MNETSVAILIAAAPVLLFGLYFSRIAKQDGAANVRHVVVWFFFGLFAAMLIFACFPQAGVSGTMFGFQLTGAAALFLLVWWRGISWGKAADDLDKRAAALDARAA